MSPTKSAIFIYIVKVDYLMHMSMYLQLVHQNLQKLHVKSSQTYKRIDLNRRNI